MREEFQELKYLYLSCYYWSIVIFSQYLAHSDKAEHLLISIKNKVQ